MAYINLIYLNIKSILKNNNNIFLSCSVNVEFYMKNIHI